MHGRRGRTTYQYEYGYSIRVLVLQNGIPEPARVWHTVYLGTVHVYCNNVIVPKGEFLVFYITACSTGTRVHVPYTCTGIVRILLQYNIILVCHIHVYCTVLSIPRYYGPTYCNSPDGHMPIIICTGRYCTYCNIALLPGYYTGVAILPVLYYIYYLLQYLLEEHARELLALVFNKKTQNQGEI